MHEIREANHQTLNLEIKEMVLEILLSTYNFYLKTKNEEIKQLIQGITKEYKTFCEGNKI